MSICPSSHLPISKLLGAAGTGQKQNAFNNLTICINAYSVNFATGYGNSNANMLRLWQAQAPESFDFQDFNVGDYYRAVQEKMVSENIAKV